MVEDALDHRRFGDESQDHAAAAAAVASQNIGAEDAQELLGPGDPWSNARGRWSLRSAKPRWGGDWARRGHDFTSPSRVGREDTVVADQVVPRRGHQGGQAPEEFGRLEQQHLVTIG